MGLSACIGCPDPLQSRRRPHPVPSAARELLCPWHVHEVALLGPWRPALRKDLPLPDRVPATARLGTATPGGAPLSPHGGRARLRRLGTERVSSGGVPTDCERVAVPATESSPGWHSAPPPSRKTDAHTPLGLQGRGQSREARPASDAGWAVGPPCPLPKESSEATPGRTPRVLLPSSFPPARVRTDLCFLPLPRSLAFGRQLPARTTSEAERLASAEAGGSRGRSGREQDRPSSPAWASCLTPSNPAFLSRQTTRAQVRAGIPIQRNQCQAQAPAQLPLQAEGSASNTAQPEGPASHQL